MLCPNCGAQVMITRSGRIGQWECGWCGQSGMLAFSDASEDSGPEEAPSGKEG